jgi:hypothetical protein
MHGSMFADALKVVVAIAVAIFLAGVIVGWLV